MSENITTAEVTKDESQKNKSPKRSWHLPKLSLAGALAIAISAACLIVGVAYLMYEKDSNRKYDIARPGQKDGNQVLTIEDDEADSTSAVTPTVAKQKIDSLTKEINALNNMGRFDAADLNDQTVQLVPSDQPSL